MSLNKEIGCPKTGTRADAQKHLLTMVNHPKNNLAGRQFTSDAIVMMIERSTLPRPVSINPNVVARTIWYRRLTNHNKKFLTYIGVVEGKALVLEITKRGLPWRITFDGDVIATHKMLNEQLATTIAHRMNLKDLTRLAQEKILSGYGITAQDLAQAPWHFLKQHRVENLVWLTCSLHGRSIHLLARKTPNSNGDYQALIAQVAAPPWSFRRFWDWIGEALG